MIRKQIAGAKRERRDKIKWRGHEVTRIEAFSDAVFAFAVTLLIVSLEVPKSSTELIETMKSFFPFAICFALLFQVWYNQNLFFRRFALNDIWTIILNGVLLFTVLFFVYPLKFLFSMWFMPYNFSIEHAEEVTYLFYIYSGGFAAIYLLFACMYFNAMKQKHMLEMDDREAFATRTEMYQYLVMVGVGLLSVIIASMGYQYSGLAGFSYVIIGPAIGMLHAYRGRMHRKKFEQPAAKNITDVKETLDQ